MLQVNNLTYSYPGSSKNVLEGVTINFERGKLYAILGNNGCGKSTLLKCIDGICSTQNCIKIDDADTDKLSQKQRAKLVSYCPQHSHASSLSVYDNIMIGRNPYIALTPTKTDHIAIKSSIDSFGLNELSNIATNKLSGGEFQRVCIARTIAQDTPVVMFDEPTNNLDIKHQHNLMHQLQHMAKDKNKCIICVLHDINMAITHADRLVFMKDGHIAKICKRNEVEEDMFQNIYDVRPKIVEIDGYRAVFV